MLKSYFRNRINLIEGSIIISAFIWFFINNSLDKQTSLEFIINSAFLILIITMIIFRNGSIRHMYFGFVLLIMSVIGDIFRYQQFTYMTSGLALSLFILGIINMMFFKIESGMVE